jgi:hypothetical protein
MVSYYTEDRKLLNVKEYVKLFSGEEKYGDKTEEEEKRKGLERSGDLEQMNDASKVEGVYQKWKCSFLANLPQSKIRKYFGEKLAL